MKRTQKYPETECFHYVNVNPKGRFRGDCVIRAISDALDQPWETTVREMTEMGIPKGLVLNDSTLYPMYLKSKGFVQRPELRKPDNTRMTVAEFIRQTRPEGAVVMNAGSHHVICIKDLKVRDIWDSSRQTAHKYWVKQ